MPCYSGGVNAYLDTRLEKSVTVMSTRAKDLEPWSLTGSNRGALLRRLLVLLLLLDLAAMVPLARYVAGDIVNGLYWLYPGMTLFPVPLDLGSVITVTAPLDAIDAFVYVLFISNGIWIAWTVVAIVYIFYPVFRRLKLRKS